MSNNFLSDLHTGFQEIHGEIRPEGSEFDFRYGLVDHLLTDALGWSRTEGDGHDRHLRARVCGDRSIVIVRRD